MKHRLPQLLLGVTCAATAMQALPNPLTVATYNIHHGVPMGGGAIDLPRIARVIRAMDADVVALQEVDRNTQRSGGVDQAEELARLTGMQVAFGSAMDFGGGQYGNAVLSKTPLLSVTNHPLPRLRNAEPRAALEVTLRSSPGAPLVRLLAVHLAYENEEGRLLQARALNELAVSAPEGALLLAGDLNAAPGSGPMAALEDRWTNAAPTKDPTFPASGPVERIDHILQRKGGPCVPRDARVIAEPGASDHRPLLTILEIPGQ